jgi:hypothetical protein
VLTVSSLVLVRLESRMASSAVEVAPDRYELHGAEFQP